jgi:hypothetical protein
VTSDRARPVLHTLWYRFRTTFGRRWGGYLSIVLLVGLVGGLALGSIAAGRRTQSAFATYLHQTNPTDLTMSAFGFANGATPNADQVGGLIARMSHLPHVRTVATLINLNAAPLTTKGVPDLGKVQNLLTVGTTATGLYQREDRIAVVAGRRADPSRPDEFTMTPTAARLVGLHVGEVTPWGFYTNDQLVEPGFGTPEVQPYVRQNMKLVGLVEASDQIVQDDVDRYPALTVFTPAITQKMLGNSNVIDYGFQLDGGTRQVSTVERELVAVLPPNSTYNYHVTSRVESDVEQAVKPESIALGVFGAIAAAVVLLLAAQAISRELQVGDVDVGVLRALGAGPPTTIGDGLVGILVALVVGALLAAALAVALSPLAPFGPVRQVYVPGLAVDWTVIGVGLAVLILGLAGIAVVMAAHRAPHRALRRDQAGSRRAGATRWAAAAGMPASGVVGVGFALDRPGARGAAPVRSALFGTALAVAVVVTTLTFGASLAGLVSHPALYGWNWTYALSGSSSVPPSATTGLSHDADVEAWAGFNVATVQLDGQSVPALVGPANAGVSPPTLSGHAVETSSQIALGAATLAQLHKHVGQSVVLSYGSAAQAPVYVPPTRLTIVGSVTMPAAGYPSIVADHPSMGTGAVVPTGVEPEAMQAAQINKDPNLNGPSLVFVRLRPGVSVQTGRADAMRIIHASDRSFAADPQTTSNTLNLLTVERPAQIVNYRSMGSTPVLLASGLVLGAVVALGLTLLTSVRRRRAELGVLKTLGFTGRQLAATVAWQASVAAVVGIVMGIPIGIAIGRQLWILFAHDISAVPAPTVPTLTIALVGVATLVLANLIAAVPGRLAARTPAAGLGRVD